MCTLLALPGDVLRYMTRWMRALDLYVVRCVCQRWRMALADRAPCRLTAYKSALRPYDLPCLAWLARHRPLGAVSERALTSLLAVALRADDPLLSRLAWLYATVHVEPRLFMRCAAYAAVCENRVDALEWLCEHRLETYLDNRLCWVATQYGRHHVARWLKHELTAQRRRVPDACTTLLTSEENAAAASKALHADVRSLAYEHCCYASEHACAVHSLATEDAQRRATQALQSEYTAWF